VASPGSTGRGLRQRPMRDQHPSQGQGQEQGQGQGRRHRSRRRAVVPLFLPLVDQRLVAMLQTPSNDGKNSKCSGNKDTTDSSADAEASAVTTAPTVAAPVAAHTVTVPALTLLGTLGLKCALPIDAAITLTAHGPIPPAAPIVACPDTGTLYTDARTNLTLSFLPLVVFFILAGLFLAAAVSAFPYPSLVSTALVMVPVAALLALWARVRARARLGSLLSVFALGACVMLVVTVIGLIVFLLIAWFAGLFSSAATVADATPGGLSRASALRLALSYAFVALFVIAPSEEAIKYLLLTHPRAAPLLLRNSPESLLYHLAFLAGVGFAQNASILWLAVVTLLPYYAAAPRGHTTWLLVAITLYNAVFTTLSHVLSGHSVISTIILRRSFPHRLPRQSRRSRRRFAPCPAFVADRWYGAMIPPVLARGVFLTLFILPVGWPGTCAY